MTDWIMIIKDKPGMAEKRVELSPAHRQGLAKNIGSGNLKMGARLLAEPVAEGQDPTVTGSCAIVGAATREEVLELVKSDVYAVEGVWDVDNIIIYPMITAYRMEHAPAQALPS